MTALALPDEELVACREHPGVWFDSFAFVEDRAKTLRKADPANAIQRELFKIYVWCQDNGVKCSIIGLKSRKEGLSTGATALAYHHLSEHTANAVVIGTDNETSDTLMRMIRRYADKDAFPWGSRFSFVPSQNRGAWTHGSEVKRDTAIDPKAGRSSTVQVLVCTEVAHWPTDGVRSADETMLSILGSMPDIPSRLRIADSTANGATGWFYDTYTDAVTFEQRKAGKMGNGWIRVFEPWHASLLRAAPVTDAERAEIEATLTDRELAGIERYRWMPEQIKWRREMIAGDCKSDEGKFDQEFPESEDVAFRASGSPRFNTACVGRMFARAEAAERARLIGTPGAPVLGHIVEAATGTIFMADQTAPWLWLHELPKPGCSYLLPIDPMTGAQSAGAKVRDRHAACILRTAYADERGQVVPAAIVAALYARDGECRWEMDVLAARAKLLAKFYGDCMVVPEVNKAMDLIPLLRTAGVRSIYRRPVRPDDSNPSEKQSAVGFLTTSATRNLWVNALSEGIREQAFECLYLPAITDFSNMIVNGDGRAEAAPKKHDDWCAGIGIGLLTQGGATRLNPQINPFLQGDVTTGVLGPWS